MEREVVELWHQVIKTQAILQLVLERAEAKDNEEPLLSEQDLKECEQQALRAVQTRFPKLELRPK